MTLNTKTSGKLLEYVGKLEEENKKLKEMCDVYIPRALKLEEENKKLEDDNRFLTKISKEYMEKENIIEITEFTELYKDKLKEENRKLREERDELDRINHNLNAQLSDLYDVKQILRDIVININRLDKLKKIVFKYDTKPEE